MAPRAVLLCSGLFTGLHWNYPYLAISFGLSGCLSRALELTFAEPEQAVVRLALRLATLLFALAFCIEAYSGFLRHSLL